MELRQGGPMKWLERNDKCWCGSGLKAKKCNCGIETKLAQMAAKGCVIPDKSLLKNEETIEGMRASGKITTMILDEVAELIKPGVSTEEINTFVHNRTLEMGGIPAPLNYHGFPKSTCTSINEVICHGIPSPDRFLKEGDIINVDVTTILNGYYSDASRMYYVGEVSETAKRLVEKTKECLEIGLSVVKPLATTNDIGIAIEKYATENGYSVVEDFGGHGLGKVFHEDPFIFHFDIGEPGMILLPGMTFTIEPMINEGEFDCKVLTDNWTAVTVDGKLSAQWEYTLVVTADGAEILAR